MKLNIISLTEIEFEGEAVSVNIKTTSGEITVLNNHQPLLTTLTAGRASIVKKDGEVFNINIESGFLEVGDNNQASLLIS